MQLASAGLTTGRLGLEIQRTISTATTALRIAQNTASQEAGSDRITEALSRVESSLFLLGEQLDALAPLYMDVHALAVERLDARSIIQHVATVFADSLRQTEARFALRAPAPLTIRMARAHLLQVLLGLFDNALYWLKFVPQGRRPEICVQLLPGLPGLIFADSGPGVHAGLRRGLFQPFFTGRSNGRGLGLYLIKRPLESYGFSIELLEEPAVLPGANFRILFGEHPAERK